MIRTAVSLVAAVAVFTGMAGTALAQKNRMGKVDELTPGTATPRIQLATFGRGALIFEKFGHTALCIDYQEAGRETVCFNYGVTEFGTDPAPLIWNFLRGNQRFWVEPVPISGMFAFYRREDRTIWIQDLPLTTEQARAIEVNLLHDLKPEHRYYFYDHFTDNCTTRLRDIVDRGTGNKLSTGAHVPFPLTFRQMGMQGLAEFPPIIAIGDFAVGRTLDVHPTLYEAMFHPDVLMREVEKRYGAAPKLIYQRRGPPIPDRGPTGRMWSLLIGLALISPLVVARLIGRGERVAIALAAVPLTLMGLLIVSMSILSTIPGLSWNEAVLLYTPLDVVLPFLGVVRRRQYARVRLTLVVIVSLLCALGVFLQPLWVPIVIAFVAFGLISSGRT